MYSFPAIKGCFGALDTYLIMIPPGEIPEVVGHDPRGMYDKKLFHLPPKTYELYENIQRAVVAKNVENLEEYVAKYTHPESVGIGALPALAVGLKTPPKFKPYETEKVDLDLYDGELGILRLLHGAKDNALYLDGLKRACAILNLFDEKKLGPITVAVMIFAPKEGQALTDTDLAQLFFDFNSKSTPIPKAVAVSRDSRDPYISLANALSETHIIKDNGGVDRKSGSLGKKSTNLVVLSDLIAFVRAATEGEWGIEHQKDKVPNPTLTDESRASFEKSIPEFFDGIIESMTRDTFRDRANHVHLMAPIWGLFGVVFHDLHVKLGMQGEALTEYGRKLGKLDWGRSAARLDQFLVDKKNGKTGRATRGWVQGGAQVRRALIPQVRNELGIAAKVDAWQARHKVASVVAAE